MNIIANNCVGGFIYKELNKQYENPFIWMNITSDDFVTLFNLYNNIDFNTFNITYEHTIWNPLLPKDTLVTTVNIKDSIKIYYTHHLYSTSYGNDMIFIEDGKRYISPNMKDTVFDRYRRLLKRMYVLNKKSEPIFIYLEWDPYKNINEFVNNGKDKKTIIITSQLETCINDNLEIYNFNDIKSGAKHIDTLVAAKYLILNSNIIKNAIETDR